MSFLADWLTVFVVGCFAVVSPGPNLAVVLRNSLVYSRRAGIYTAVGLAAGNLVHAAYCLAGIGVVVSRSLMLFSVIKWAGAAYLIYIGIKALRANRQVPDEAAGDSIDTGDPGSFTAIRIGFLTNLLNPKVTLFFLALFTQIIRPETPLHAQAVYALTMVGLEFAWFAVVAGLVSQRTVRARFASVSHWVERITGAFLISLGIRLAFIRADG